MTKTVLQAIWRPEWWVLVSHYILNRRKKSRISRHTEIFHKHFACLGNILVLCNHSLAVLERLPGRCVEQANAVVVAEASLLRNQLLDIFNRGAGRDVNGWGKLLDALLRSYEGKDDLVRICRTDESINLKCRLGTEYLQRFVSLSVVREAILTQGASGDDGMLEGSRHERRWGKDQLQQKTRLGVSFLGT